MARIVEVILEIDDRGTAKVKRMSRAIKRESAKAKAAAKSNFDNMAKSVGGSIDKMTTRFLKFGGLIGAVLGGLALRAVIKFGAGFESTMSGVRAVTQATEKDFRMLSDQARELGATTQFTAIQAAEAMEELGKAGFATVEILQTMPDVLFLAAAGQLEMAEAASITADVIRSMGLALKDFTEATNIMARTAVNAKTTILELGFAYQDAAPVARSLGLTFKDLNVLLGVLANRGFVATRAGTALRRIFAVFLGDIEEGEKGLAKFNVELARNEDGTVNLEATFRALAEAGADANEIMKAFGLRGGPAALQIVDALTNDFAKMKEAMADTNVTAETLAKVRMDNLRGKGLELSSAMQEVALVLFDQIVPALTKAAIGATDLIRSWGELLKRSDVWSGIRRIIRLATIAAGIFAVAIGVGLIRKMQLLILKGVIPMIAGFDAFKIELLSQLPVIAAWQVATKGMRLGMVGAGVAAGVLGWQLGRMIAELTGLDPILQDFFDDFISGADNAAVALRSVEAEVIAILVRQEKLAESGINLELDVDTTAAVASLKALGDPATFLRRRSAEIFETLKKGAKGATNELERLEQEAVLLATANARAANELEALVAKQDAAGESLRRTITIQDQFLRILRESPDAADALAAAYEEAGEQVEDEFARMELAIELFSKRSQEVIKAAEENLIALIEGEKILAKQFGKTGLATAKAADELKNKYAKALFFANDAGLEAGLVVRAFAVDVKKMVDAATAAGVEVPDALLAILDQARELEEIDDFFADPLDRLNARLADLDFPELEGISESIGRLRELSELAAMLTEQLASEDPSVVIGTRIRLEQVKEELREIVGQLDPARLEALGLTITIPADIEPRIEAANAAFLTLTPVISTEELAAQALDIRDDFEQLELIEALLPPREFEARALELRQKLGAIFDKLGPSLFDAFVSFELPGFDPAVHAATLEEIRALTADHNIQMLEIAALFAEDAATMDLENTAASIEAIATLRLDAIDARLEAELAALEERQILSLLEVQDTEDSERKEQEIRDKFAALRKLAEDKASKARIKTEKEEAAERQALRLRQASASVALARELFGDIKEVRLAQIIVDTAAAIAEANPNIPLMALAAAIGAAQFANAAAANPGAFAGGIITGRRTIDVGERGDEVIVPLRGQPAKEAARALGIVPVGEVSQIVDRSVEQTIQTIIERIVPGAVANDRRTPTLPAAAPPADVLELQGGSSTSSSFSSREASSRELVEREIREPVLEGGSTVNVTLNLNGDNFADTGVPEALVEVIHDGLDQAIQAGLRRPFSTESF